METPHSETDSTKFAAKVGRPVSIGQAVAVLVAVALLIWAIYAARDWRRLSAACDAAEVAELGAVSVDFSRPGQYEIAVPKRFPLAHGVSHILWLDRSIDEKSSAQELLRGLTGTVKCVLEDGKAFIDDPIDLDRISVHENKVELGGFGGGPAEYRLQVEITNGAPALAGVQQRLMAMNGMCGLERVVPGVSGVFSLAMAAIAMVILTCVWRTARRRKKHHLLRRQPRPE